MADAGFFKGTSADQDRRFSDKEVKLLKSMKFPPEFDKKVDMRKVNLQVIRPWIAKKVVELVGFEDEVVVEYAMGLLEDKQQPTPDPKKMQINLTGFLTNSTPSFMSALWSLLLEAQDSPAGVPRTFIEEKKEEMRKAKEGDSRALDERDRRARPDDVRPNDRGGRGGGRGRGRGRGRGGFDDDRGGRPRDGGWGPRGGGPGRSYRRSSRSPPPPPHRRRSPSRETRGSRSPPPRRYRSPPRRSRSPPYKARISRSPPPNRRRPRSPSSRSMSRSRSRSPPPQSRRRLRSPSYTPPRERRYRVNGARDSRSPPPRRRRISPARSMSRSPSRSRSPPLKRNILGRRRSASPPRRKIGRRSPSRSRSRSGSRSPRRSPPRRRSLSRGRGQKNRRDSGSRSSSPSKRGDDAMDVDGGGIKIKGQAEVLKRKSKWEDDVPRDGPSGSYQYGKSDLEKRENELKEKALRNKVVKTRKSSSGA